MEVSTWESTLQVGSSEIQLETRTVSDTAARRFSWKPTLYLTLQTGSSEMQLETHTVPDTAGGQLGDAAGNPHCTDTLQVGSSEMYWKPALYQTLQVGSSEMQLETRTVPDTADGQLRDAAGQLARVPCR
ncbi:LOW QUALITY PROTEIN: hypothetical protein U0070_007178 [Myodes glareolus]|uniref:Uncharacterized protein n=1 Tax=Myodes glareolus TaxID=447135 RepID=A0AAW0HJ17_MYOGA